MSANRHLGRIIVLQTCYEYDFRHECGDTNANLEDILDRNIDRYASTLEDHDFVRDLSKGVINNTNELDKLLQPIAPEWPISQIARMDRTVLRMGAYELLNIPDTPPKVVINEAVELAKAFGGDNSSKFVNGVMGTLLKQREENTADEVKPKSKKAKS